MDGRELVTRAIEFRGPERVPYSVGISGATWKAYRERLSEAIARYPQSPIFGYSYEYAGDPGASGVNRNYDRFGDGFRAGERYTDRWGVVWDNVQDGLQGYIAHHPLADWRDLPKLQPPDPLVYDERGGPVDWECIRRQIAASGHRRFIMGKGDRVWERVHFLRGMENALLDVAEGRPELTELIEIIVEVNIRKIKLWLAQDIDAVSFMDDWGTQQELMISPAAWRRLFKPAYARQFELIRNAGRHVYFHSDGHILPIIPDLIEVGVTVINPQVSANGLEPLARLCRGRICVNLDLDRQQILAMGTPEMVRAHIRECLEAFAPQEVGGGLILSAGFYPPAPLENVVAAYEAFAEFC